MSISNKHLHQRPDFYQTKVASHKVTIEVGALERVLENACEIVADFCNANITCRLR